MRRSAFIALALAGCTAAQANRWCVGGISDPSEACILVDSVVATDTGAAIGAVGGAYCLNHDCTDQLKGFLWPDGGAIIPECPAGTSWDSIGCRATKDGGL